MMTLQQPTNTTVGAGMISEGDSRSVVSAPSRMQQPVRQQSRDDNSMTTTLQECLFGDAPFRTQMKKSAVLKQLKENVKEQTNTEVAAVADHVSKHDGGDDDDDSSTASIVDELAPVSSKWSECSAASISFDEDSVGLLPHTVNIQLLRKIVSAGGVVEDADSGISHRAVAWRVLLGYLPEETDRWYDVLMEKRNLYTQLAAELFAETADVVETADELRGRPRQFRPTLSYAASPTARRKLATIPSHVKQHWKKKSLDLNVLERLTKDLNALQMKDLVVVAKENEEAEETNEEGLSKREEQDEANLDDFVESALLLDEIRKDVVRTHPDLSFFLEPFHNLGRRRYAALERILFVWSKYNKGVRYVQGMNEIVGILYYVLANDQNEEWAVWAEADTYWLFHVLLAEMSDVFVAGLDEHATGIQGRINAMQALLARHDPEVKEHLDEIGIEVSFYAIRWWTTLLSREFLLPDTIRLWDSMFASTHKDNFLRYVCVTMVMTMRDRLLKSDFSTCLKLLHAFPSTSIERLLESSRSLWIYESQISVACHRGGLSLHQALTTIESPPALIIAFGFPNGTPPVSRVEQLERAKVNVEATVRSAAQEMFGRARGLYNRYSKDYVKKERSNSADRDLTLGRAKEEDAMTKEQDDEDVYLKAILHS